jgi:mannan endo-1,4-beta-mannosidase
MLNGKTFRFTGVTANEATTWWPVNWGCGSEITDLDGFFSSLHPGSVVEVAAMQALAFNNKTTHAIDFTAIDRVVQAAESRGIKLWMGLSDQQGTCDDGHWKDQAWYDGGYRRAYNDDGRNLSRLSYWDYIHLIVPRYKDSPAIGAWVPMGEPEASNCDVGYSGSGCYGHDTCPSGAAASLRSFFDTVGAEIKAMDPNHLVASGTLSRLPCGLSGDGYLQVISSPYVDIASYHDYGNAAIALPPDLDGAISDAQRANKAFAMDEGGIYAQGTGCGTTAQRSDEFKAKMDAQFSAGSSGFMAWNWEPLPYGTCSDAILPGDLYLALLWSYDPIVPLLAK